MQYFRANIKVGFFLLFSLALFVAAAIIVGRVDDWFAHKHRYLVLFQNAGLLRPRAKVSYAGYVVGEVATIAIQAGGEQAKRYPGYYVTVSIVVEPWVTVRDDSRIDIKTDGFIGDRYLDITPGQGAILPPESMIVGTLGGLEGLVASFSGTGGGLKEITDSLRTLLMDATDPNSFPTTLGSLRQLVEDLRPRLAEVSIALATLLLEVKDEVKAASSKAVTTLHTLDTTVAENRAGLQRAVVALNTTLGQAQKTLKNTQTLVDSTKGDIAKILTSVHKLSETTRGDTATLLASMHTLSETLRRDTGATLEQLQQVIAHADTLLVQNDRHLFTTMENLRDSTDNLKAATRQVRSNPAVLVWGSAKQADLANGYPTTTRTLQDRGRVGRYDRVQ